MLSKDVPDRFEVSTEASRVIELLKKSLVRLSEKEPIGIQFGDAQHVKGTKSKGDDYD